MPLMPKPGAAAADIEGQRGNEPSDTIDRVVGGSVEIWDENDDCSPARAATRSSAKSFHAGIGRRSVFTTSGAPRESVLTGAERLATSPKAVVRAVWAALFCVFVDGISGYCVAANHVLMVSPGAHPGSFPHTNPFGIFTALYVMNGLSSLALVISSFVCGRLVDSHGARPVLLVLMLASAVLALARYFARASYWAFTVVYFLNCLFGASTAVTAAYIGKLFKDDRGKCDAYLGYSVAIMVVGRSSGGMLTILFPANLFYPLFPAAALSLLAFFVAHKFVLDPGKVMLLQGLNTKEKDAAEEDKKYPKEIHVFSAINIVIGAFLDNVGSLGIIRKYMYMYVCMCWGEGSSMCMSVLPARS